MFPYGSNNMLTVLTLKTSHNYETNRWSPNQDSPPPTRHTYTLTCLSIHVQSRKVCGVFLTLPLFGATEFDTVKRKPFNSLLLPQERSGICWEFVICLGSAQRIYFCFSWLRAQAWNRSLNLRGKAGENG